VGDNGGDNIRAEKGMTNRQAALKIIRRLRSKGFQGLLAGGCVRDMLLGRRAKDYDVATDAGPEDVMGMFRRTLKVGAKFGVVIVLMDKSRVEVATFRTETGYGDGRHPDRVRFATAAEDAARRDFTVNGMFYDPVKRQVLDFVDGRADLKKALIRTIGRPEERFGEDYLRMLRAIRFSAQLSFKIERRTFAAVCGNAEKIINISGERISAELEGMLVSFNRSGGLRLLFKSGLADVIFPGIDEQQRKFAVKVLTHLPERIDFPLGLAAVFAGCQTEFAIEKCKILRLSRSAIRHIKFLLTSRGKLLDEKMSLAQLRLIVAEPYFQDLYDLQKAIQTAKRQGITRLVGLKRRIKALGDMELKPKALLNGHDLMGLGAVAGPRLGQLAREMYIAQLEGKLQKRRQAEQWVQKWLRRRSE